MKVRSKIIGKFLRPEELYSCKLAPLSWVEPACECNYDLNFSHHGSTHEGGTNKNFISALLGWLHPLGWSRNENMKLIKLKRNTYFKLFLYFYIFIFLFSAVNSALAKDKDDFFVQPKVIETKPLNGAQNVPVDSEIFIKFNTQMAKWSVEENLTISPNIQGKIDWYCGWELTFIPDEDFQCGATYNIKIDGQSVSKNGYPLGHDYIFSFSTIRCEGQPDLPEEQPPVVPTTTPPIVPSPLKPEVNLEKKLLNPKDGFQINEELEFEIKIINSGETLLKEIPLVDAFNKEHLNFISATPTFDSLATSTVSSTSSNLNWNDLTQHFGSLSPGQDMVIKLLFKVATSTSIISQNLALSENIKDELGNILPLVKDMVEFKINEPTGENGESGQDSGQGGSDEIDYSSDKGSGSGGSGAGGPSPQIEPSLIFWIDYAAEKIVGGLCLEKINLKNSGGLNLTNGSLTLNLPEDKLKFISSSKEYQEYDDFNQRVIWQIPDLLPEATTSIDFEIKALSEGEALTWFKIDFNEINLSTTTDEMVKSVAFVLPEMPVEQKKPQLIEQKEQLPKIEAPILPIVAGEEIYPALKEELTSGLEVEQVPLVILPQIYSETAEKCADCSKWIWLLIILIHLVCLAIFYIYLLPEKIINIDANNQNINLPNDQNNIKILKGNFKWLWPVLLGLILVFLILFFACKFNLFYSVMVLVFYYAALFFYYLLLRHQTGKIKKIWPAILITLLPVLVYILCSPWSVWAWILVILFYGLTMFFYYLSLIKLEKLKWWAITVFCLTILVVILERVMEGCGCV